MYSKKLLLLTMFLLMSFVSINVNIKSADALSRMQKRNAERIAKYTADHYDKYGVLPSIAVAQAMQESSLGKHCPNYNMWGLASGRIYCSSVENGCQKYLRVINNGCYKGAPFCKDWRTQIRRILRGGYCEPVGSYYSYVVSIVTRYNLTKYDKKMWKDRKAAKEAKKKLKEKKRKARLAKKKAAEAKKRLEQQKKKEEAAKKANAIPTLPSPLSSIANNNGNKTNNTLDLSLDKTESNNISKENNTNKSLENVPLNSDVKDDSIIVPETIDLVKPLDMENRRFIEYKDFEFIKKR